LIPVHRAHYSSASAAHLYSPERQAIGLAILNIIDRGDDPETLDYILENLQLLRDFYSTSAKESQAVITFLS